MKYGVPVNRVKEFNVQRVIQPSENLINERQICVDEEREKTNNANKKICDRTVKYFRKRRKCSKYKKEESIERKTGKKHQNKDSSSLEG